MVFQWVFTEIQKKKKRKKQQTKKHIKIIKTKTTTEHYKNMYTSRKTNKHDLCVCVT